MKKMMLWLGLACCTHLALAATVLKVPMYLLSKGGSHQYIGDVLAKNSPYGLILLPDLKGLPPGIHGFHVHTNPSCADDGLAAGGHLDPAHTNKHLGPYNSQGHLGDLPVLYVNKNGTATLPILAPRLRVNQLIGHSLIIHAGGDNYADTPEPLGGGGARLACGVVK